MSRKVGPVEEVPSFDAFVLIACLLAVVAKGTVTVTPEPNERLVELLELLRKPGPLRHPTVSLLSCPPASLRSPSDSRVASLHQANLVFHIGAEVASEVRCQFPAEVIWEVVVSERDHNFRDPGKQLVFLNEARERPHQRLHDAIVPPLNEASCYLRAHSSR